jgi:hypothetical protein
MKLYGTIGGLALITEPVSPHDFARKMIAKFPVTPRGTRLVAMPIDLQIHVYYLIPDSP